MKKDYFVNKLYCEFTIVSDEIEPEEISHILGISPDRFFVKGETSLSRNSGSVIKKPHNLWSISSSAIISEEVNISSHLEHLKLKLIKKIKVLKRLKSDVKYELSFWVWLETDNSGIGLDISEQEMLFLTECSNRVHFSFITNDEI